jgi:protein-S-isoprenylcysteine O-methyltransferase Ste14
MLHVRRHLMPALSLAVWLGAALALRVGAATLAMGVGLFAAFWLVEASAIEGGFSGKVPRHPIVMSSRVLWLAALAFSVLDAERLHVSTLAGWPVRAAGAALFLAGVGLRLWSMRTLRRAFTYDLTVSEGQDLVMSGPYAVVRHPSYSGLVLLSLACGVWNPSALGLAALAVTTVPQVVVRIGFEEAMLAEHFGERWRAYAARTRRLVPGLW